MDNFTIILIFICFFGSMFAGTILGAIWLLGLIVEPYISDYYVYVNGKPTYLYSISDRRRWVWRIL